MRDITALYNAKMQMVINSLRASFSQSKLKVIVIVSFMMVFSAGLYILFYGAFRFLFAIEPSVSRIIIDRLIYLFYFSIFVMLVVSSILVSFSTIYSSREIPFLLVTPLEHGRIFSHKLFESAILSAWSFIFVVGAFAIAYGVFCRAPATYYIMYLLLFVPFLIIPCAIGSIIVTILVRWYTPERLKWFSIAAVGVVILGTVVYFVQLRKIPELRQDNLVLALNTLIPHFRYCQYPLIPSYWLCESILGTVRGRYSATFFFFLVLASNALFLPFIAQNIGSRLFYRGWLAVNSPGRTKRYALNKSIIEALLHPLKRILNPARYALVVKDMKVFWRNPAQWTQVIIFFGLLGIYFSNLQNFSYNFLKPVIKQFTSLCNLSAMMLVLASITVRFIYPRMSLEGNKYWLIGTAPIQFKTVFLQKLWASLLWTLPLSLGLMVTSNTQLEIDPLFMLFSYGAVICMSVTLVSMSCGFGVLFPNFKEDNPARLVAGFGGTLLFVLSLAYVVFIITLLSWPFGLYYSMGDELTYRLIMRFIYSAMAIVIVSSISSWISISLGLRAMQRLEF